jgi:hypothetical protein
MRIASLALFLCLAPCLTNAADPYDAFSALPNSGREPRPLNTEDVPELRSHNPRELVTPEGDFNHDGNPDLAVSGIFDLPRDKNRFFLLVATFKSGRASNLYYREFDRPVFLHRAGTTGSSDPKTQAFSYTFCWECEQGFDVVWSSSTHSFDSVSWERQKTAPVPTAKPLPEVPDSLVDEALKLVGVLPDVKSYVKAVQDKKGKLRTRVEWASLPENTVWVSIFERTEKGEAVFDRFLVSGKEKKILKRQGTSGDK